MPLAQRGEDVPRPQRDNSVTRVATLRTFYAGTRRTLPKDLPTGFIRRSWRSAVFRDGAIDGQAYELCLFAELRDRLRAGDVWVVGSRQYRAVEDQLISKPLFAGFRCKVCR